MNLFYGVFVDERDLVYPKIMLTYAKDGDDADMKFERYSNKTTDIQEPNYIFKYCKLASKIEVVE